MAGLLGGLTHCTLMCGPFVASQVVTRINNVAKTDFSFKTRLKHASLLNYHLGRATTYVFLAFLVSLVTSQFLGSYFFNIISIILLCLAAIIFIDNSFANNSKFKFTNSRFSEFLSNKTAPLFKNPEGLNSYFIGILLGFLPCGLVIAALMVTATIANPFISSLAMLVFSLATIPALIIVGLGATAIKKLRAKPQIGKALMGLNGLNLFILAGTIFYREIL